MALLFGGQAAGGDIATGSPLLSLGRFVTFFVWIRPNSYGALGFGKAINHGDDGSGTVHYRGLIDLNSANTTWRWVSGTSANVGVWRGPTGQIALGAWQSLAATYDYLNLATTPGMYFNGVPIAATLVQAPTGTGITDDRPFYIGNTANRIVTFDGSIAHAMCWSRVLTDAEIQLVHQFGPSSAPTGLQLYYPMEGLFTQDYSALQPSLTLSGPLLDTSFSPYPPSRMLYVYPSAVPATTLYVRPPATPQPVLVVSGITRDAYGNALGLCDVLVYDQETKTLDGATTSDAGGNFWVQVLKPGWKQVVANLHGNPDVAGVTIRLVPSTQWAVGT